MAETKTRKSRRAYFEAAMTILREDGFEGLTIPAMCAYLGVTKGSFYHHFADADEFAALLMAHWESDQTVDLFDDAEALGSSRERGDLILDRARSLDHRAECAIRIWATTNGRVAETLARVDDARVDRVAQIWNADGLPAAEAHTAATMGFAIVVGFQHFTGVFDSAGFDECMNDMTTHFRNRIREIRATEGSGEVGR